MQVCSCFAPRGFGTGETIEWYYGTMVYGNLISKKQKLKAYGKGGIFVTVQTSTKWSICTHDQATDGNGTMKLRG